MAGPLEDLLGGAGLDRTAEVDDAHPVRDVPHHRQIVRDEEVRESQLGLEPLEQVEHPGLYGHVERGHRFVEHEQVRFDGERSGDPDALSLPTGELVREAGGVRRFESDLGEQFGNPPGHGGAVRALGAQRLGDDVADRHPRVEAGHRVLEDDLDPAAQRLAVGLGQSVEGPSEELDVPAFGADEVQQFEEGGGLAGSGLPDERECFTGPDGEVHAVDRVDGADTPFERGPLEDGERLGEPGDAQDPVAGEAARSGMDGTGKTSAGVSPRSAISSARTQAAR